MASVSGSITGVTEPTISYSQIDDNGTKTFLAHDGEFGFTAVLSINMKSENAGLYANLFYYNESTGELEFISCAIISTFKYFASISITKDNHDRHIAGYFQTFLLLIIRPKEHH